MEGEDQQDFSEFINYSPVIQFMDDLETQGCIQADPTNNNQEIAHGSHLTHQEHTPHIPAQPWELSDTATQYLHYEFQNQSFAEAVPPPTQHLSIIGTCLHNNELVSIEAFTIPHSQSYPKSSTYQMNHNSLMHGEKVMPQASLELTTTVFGFPKILPYDPQARSVEGNWPMSSQVYDTATSFFVHYHNIANNLPISGTSFQHLQNSIHFSLQYCSMSSNPMKFASSASEDELKCLYPPTKLFCKIHKPLQRFVPAKLLAIHGSCNSHALNFKEQGYCLLPVCSADLTIAEQQGTAQHSTRASGETHKKKCNCLGLVKVNGHIMCSHNHHSQSVEVGWTETATVIGLGMQIQEPQWPSYSRAWNGWERYSKMIKHLAELHGLTRFSATRCQIYTKHLDHFSHWGSLAKNGLQGPDPCSESPGSETGPSISVSASCQRNAEQGRIWLRMHQLTNASDVVQVHSLKYGSFEYNADDIKSRFDCPESHQISLDRLSGWHPAQVCNSHGCGYLAVRFYQNLILCENHGVEASQRVAQRKREGRATASTVSNSVS